MSADVGSLLVPPPFTLDISLTSTISSTCGVTDLTAKLDECRCFATSPPDEPNVTVDPLTAPEESTLMPQPPSSASPSPSPPPPDPPPVPLGRTRKRVRKRKRRRRQQKV
ncbi:unnamed protein product [Dibothriocephalus latus]|uniref:Uncharacterized protein n=1 Tax=Dibothriocephalus latus TaxID=60516 RepID=A0A3P7N6G9_DIBLA|nr:unnamed protein product [Dibothriocephalus latus]